MVIILIKIGYVTLQYPYIANLFPDSSLQAISLHNKVKFIPGLMDN